MDGDKSISRYKQIINHHTREVKNFFSINYGETRPGEKGKTTCHTSACPDDTAREGGDPAADAGVFCGLKRDGENNLLDKPCADIYICLAFTQIKPGEPETARASLLQAKTLSVTSMCPWTTRRTTSALSGVGSGTPLRRLYPGQYIVPRWRRTECCFVSGKILPEFVECPADG